MDIKRFSVGCAIVTCLAAGASAQVSKSGPGYLFKMKYRVGTTKYGMNVNVKNVPGATGGAMTISGPLMVKVESVKGTLANLAITTGPLAMNGKPMIKATTQKVQADEKGKQFGGTGSVQGLPSGLPQRPVKVGETWQAEVPITSGMMSGQKVSATYKFVGIKAVGAIQCAQLNMTMSGATSGTGTTYLNTADCQLVRMSMNMTMQMPGAAAGKPIVMAMTVARK